MDRGDCFQGRQFTAEVILWAVRWYLMFPISYRDLELMLLDRGVDVDHTTIFRWIQAYAEELEKRIRPHLRMSNGSWRVDETYVRVKGRWMYLYRAVDSRGQTIDFLLAARRDMAAAKRFFRKALAQPHTVNPRTLTVDKNPAYPRAVAEMKKDGELWRRSRLRQCKYLNNIVEQDHRRIKRLVRSRSAFWRVPNRPKNIGRFRSDGDDPERADSKDRRTRYPRTGDLHRRSFRYGRIKEIGSSLSPSSHLLRSSLQQSPTVGSTPQVRSCLSSWRRSLARWLLSYGPSAGRSLQRKPGRPVLLSAGRAGSGARKVGELLSLVMWPGCCLTPVL